MSRSNLDKPFYVDVGTSVVAIRCASNHDVIVEYDFSTCPQLIGLTRKLCDRINREVEIGRPLRNCDVGDAAEQQVRFLKFCDSHTTCASCPATTARAHCELVWAQMPYEEGGAK